MIENWTAGKVKFNQYAFVHNGYMNEKGACLGLSIDWLRYISKYHGSEYITDKYNYIVNYSDDYYDFDTDTPYEYTTSKNFYNRINYYQIYGNQMINNYTLTDIDKCKTLPEHGILALYNNYEYYGHATVYSIEKYDNKYVLAYFDANIGEFEGIFYDSIDNVKQDLKTLVKYMADNYSEYINGECYFDEILVLENTDKFVDDMYNSWKKEKQYIENMGIYADSPNFTEIKDYIYS
ncbi:MAG: hypothetical protein J0G32_04875 [Alphaproteobacteria bacterium]|mgnify:CR=1 FL=1|nr:hypothetical protein [Alphaproteobacteria bacterium]OJV15079.1 MAG: hypothetical protein BGO27_06545 [Alphaproteobacteria bacterium 33-17]